MMAFPILLYIFTFFCLAIWFSRTEGFVSLIVVFGVTGFYYYLSVPLELWWRGEAYVLSGGLFYSATPDVQLKISFLACVALLSFALGLFHSGFRLVPPPGLEVGRRVKLPRSILLLGMLALCVLFAGYGISAIRGLSDYYEGHAIRNEHPSLSAAVQYLLLSLVVVAATLFAGDRAQRLAAWSIVGLVAIWGFYSQDKDPIVQGGLAILAPYAGRRSQGWTFLLIVCLGAFVAIGGLPLFSAYRGNAGLDLRRLWSDFSVLDTDASGPTMSLAVTTANPPEWRMGSTYLLGGYLLIPRRIWPDRPPSLAEEFAIDNMPRERWFAGAGYGFSLLAESYLNFGVLGAVLQYAALGWLLGKAWRWTEFRFGRDNWHFWKAMYVCSAFMCMVIMHRGATNQIVRYMSYYVMVPWLLFAVLDSRLFSRRERGSVLVKRGPQHACALDT